MFVLKKVFGIIFVGGEGKCFMFFIVDCVKFVVFFGGQYCLIDFVILNFINFGLCQIVVLMQYKLYSFDWYILQIWWMLVLFDLYVVLVFVQQCFGK